MRIDLFGFCGRSHWNGLRGFILHLLSVNVYYSWNVWQFSFVIRIVDVISSEIRHLIPISLDESQKTEFLTMKPTNKVLNKKGNTFP